MNYTIRIFLTYLISPLHFSHIRDLCCDLPVAPVRGSHPLLLVNVLHVEMGAGELTRTYRDSYAGNEYSWSWCFWFKHVTPSRRRVCPARGVCSQENDETRAPVAPIPSRRLFFDNAQSIAAGRNVQRTLTTEPSHENQGRRGATVHKRTWKHTRIHTINRKTACETAEHAEQTK